MKWEISLPSFMEIFMATNVSNCYRGGEFLTKQIFNPINIKENQTLLKKKSQKMGFKKTKSEQIFG